MRKHNGMRPQDVALLLKLTLPDSNLLQGTNLATSLYLSAAEASDSLKRCQYSRLLEGRSQARRVNLRALLDFLSNGLPYTFPNTCRGAGPRYGEVVWTSRTEEGRIFLPLGQPKPAGRRLISGVKYDEAFKAEALRLASGSRSTQAAARQLGAEVGSVEATRDPEVRALPCGQQTTGAGARHFKKALVLCGQPPP